MKEKKEEPEYGKPKITFFRFTHKNGYFRIHHQIIVPHQECKIGKKRKNH